MALNLEKSYFSFRLNQAEVSAGLQTPILVDSFFVFIKYENVLCSLDLSNGAETELPEARPTSLKHFGARIVSGRLLVLVHGDLIQFLDLRSGSLIAKVDVGTFLFQIADHVPKVDDDDDLLCYIWHPFKLKLFKLISGKTTFYIYCLVVVDAGEVLDDVLGDVFGVELFEYLQSMS